MGWLDRFLKRTGERMAKSALDTVKGFAERELERGRATERMRDEREAQAEQRRRELGIRSPSDSDDSDPDDDRTA